MPTPRRDSIFKRLGAYDRTEELRDRVFMELTVGARDPDDVAAELSGMDPKLKTSGTALGLMISQCGLAWRVQQAGKAAQAADESGGPSITQAEERARKNLKLAIFDLSFQKLSAAEAAMLNRELREDKKVQLAMYETQREAADFILQVLSEEKRAAELREIASREESTEAETIEELRQRVYGANAVPQPESRKEAA